MPFTTDFMGRDADVVEYRQDPIPKSEYQNRLDEGEAEDGEDDTEEKKERSTIETGQIRYWSDYSRVYLHPRSMQRLPDLADWETADGDWNTSRESFRQHEQARIVSPL